MTGEDVGKGSARANIGDGDAGMKGKTAVDIANAATLEYIRDLSLDLHRLAERTGCKHLSDLLAAAAAEAHHQTQARRQQ